MKSFASKFNKTTFGIDTADFTYTKLGEKFQADGEGVVYPINGIYVHKSPLGDSPVIIDEGAKQLVNVPSHMAETFREILADDAAVNAIKNGEVGYTIYTYESHKKTCYSVNFVDM